MLWPLLPAHLLASAIVVTVAALRGRGLAAWRGFIAGFALDEIWRARKIVQRERRVGWLAIARALAWSPEVLFTRRPVIQVPSR